MTNALLCNFPPAVCRGGLFAKRIGGTWEQTAARGPTLFVCAHETMKPVRVIVSCY
jgi:hypothetical protein